MAARNKPPPRDTPGIPDLFGLSLTASERREALLEQVQHLRAAGKIREAKRLVTEGGDVHRRLQALEAEIRSPPGPRTQK
jgi:hypothetical protein